MADIFTKSDARNLLQKKTLWFFGDSNVRGLYKDLIWLLEKNSLIGINKLKSKLEPSFLNDRLIKGGALHRGRNFQEIRQYKNFNLQINIEFTFLTQCFSQDLQSQIKDGCRRNNVPDVIAISSCLWDITRWGPDSISKYKAHILDLLDFLKSNLPRSTRVIWITTPPISSNPKGGFFIKQIEFLKHTLRFDVMEANTFVSREFSSRGFDVLDVHYHLLLQIHRRSPDGIHWTPEPVRHMTNLLLTHISISWNIPLPGNFRSPLLKSHQVSSKPISAKAAQALKPIGNTLTSSIPGTKKKGVKRHRNENSLQKKSSSTIDFTEDIFDYNYNTKKFKFGV